MPVDATTSVSSLESGLSSSSSYRHLNQPLTTIVEHFPRRPTSPRSPVSVSMTGWSPSSPSSPLLRGQLDTGLGPHANGLLSSREEKTRSWILETASLSTRIEEEDTGCIDEEHTHRSPSVREQQRPFPPIPLINERENPSIWISSTKVEKPRRSFISSCRRLLGLSSRKRHSQSSQSASPTISSPSSKFSHPEAPPPNLPSRPFRPKPLIITSTLDDDSFNRFDLPVSPAVNHDMPKLKATRRRSWLPETSATRAQRMDGKILSEALARLQPLPVTPTKARTKLTPPPRTPDGTALEDLLERFALEERERLQRISLRRRSIA
ncbi:hypothetical protein P7C70_g4414, partial [Phenoliferia sp. Uapishka_3]